MSSTPLDLVFIGLSITSTWGNGHATTYRDLLGSLAGFGHRVLFLERDAPWFANHRDVESPEGCTTLLYDSVDELRDRFGQRVRNADAVILGSHVTEGTAVADWIFETARGTTAFYDLETPLTLERLRMGDAEYLGARQVSMFDQYYSFSGGPALHEIEHRFGARRALPLYCSVDPERSARTDCPPEWELSFLGAYDPDYQDALERLLLEPARRWDGGTFVVAGPQYPRSVRFPKNVQRLEHVARSEHADFFTASRFTLNVTRPEMVRLGYSPSALLFEAAASGTPTISEPWLGLGSFFEIDRELLVAGSPIDVLQILHETTPEQARAIGERARRRVLEEHTSGHRAAQLTEYLKDARRGRVSSVASGHPFSSARSS